MKRSQLLCMVCFIAMAACSNPPVATPLPSLQTVDVAYPPELSPLSLALNACAASLPYIALFVYEIPGQATRIGDYDLVFSLGEQFYTTGEGPAFSAPLAWENIAVVVQAETQSGMLSRADLKALFEGRTVTWEGEQLNPQPVQVWVYPDGSRLRALFDQLVLSGGNVSTHARLAPETGAMLEGVSSEPGSIGYLPAAWLKDEDNHLVQGVRQVELGDDLSALLRQPLLAATTSEPHGAARDLLACLQGPVGQKMLKERYEAWKLD